MSVEDSLIEIETIRYDQIYEKFKEIV